MKRGSLSYDRSDLKRRFDQNDTLGSHWKTVEPVTTLNAHWIVWILCRTLAVTTYHYPHLCQCQFQHRLMSTSTLRLSTLTIVTNLPSWLFFSFQIPTRVSYKITIILHFLKANNLNSWIFSNYCMRCCIETKTSDWCLQTKECFKNMRFFICLILYLFTKNTFYIMLKCLTDSWNMKSNIYGQCDIPLRTSSTRTRRSNEDNREIIKLRTKIMIQTK